MEMGKTEGRECMKRLLQSAAERDKELPYNN